MMILLPVAAAVAAAVAVQSATPPADEGQFGRCTDLVRTDPAAARADAIRWRIAGGGAAARQCAGLAYVAEGDFTAAAAEFDAAARLAQAAKDARAASYQAQAGNAWLAAGDAAKARAALDAALSAGTLSGLQRGEAQLDRARALVAQGALAAARTDIDLALRNAADDPLAWLLSATLARRMGDMPRAQTDIAEALRRAADDAQVQLEAGNIAASNGDEAATRRAWGEAVRLAPDSPAGRSAAAALGQFAAK
ncbi:MAG TPA: hypothetical protein VFQ57_08025 [Sphingomonas sp.]|jgi:hypothetical protein|nr:hypothetical protein [Sphingomonas sp.]